MKLLKKGKSGWPMKSFLKSVNSRLNLQRGDGRRGQPEEKQREQVSRWTKDHFQPVFKSGRKEKGKRLPESNEVLVGKSTKKRGKRGRPLY